ncbi:MAG TPA: DUF1330 domain-containing protein [Xanthobacteraceae bacterium]|nr:DUF1330 domain-containing protein [Xanthobacteraceae bacterium]
MAKGYWVTFYRAVKDPEAVAAYAKAAGPAIVAAGGRFLARGVAAQTYEAGRKERSVVIEFPSVAAAVACHDGAPYQAALKLLGPSAAERDFRIIEGVE